MDPLILHREWIYFGGNEPGADTDIGCESEAPKLNQFEHTVAGVNIRFGRRHKKDIDISEEKTDTLDGEFDYAAVVRMGFLRYPLFVVIVLGFQC